MKKYTPLYIAIVFCIITTILASIEYNIKITGAWIVSCIICLYIFIGCYIGLFENK